MAVLRPQKTWLNLGGLAESPPTDDPDEVAYARYGSAASINILCRALSSRSYEGCPLASRMINLLACRTTMPTSSRRTGRWSGAWWATTGTRRRRRMVVFRRCIVCRVCTRTFFQPVMRLSRHGARVHKGYNTARTPYQRLMERGVLSAEEHETLARRCRTLNPVRLKAQLDVALEALWTTADRHQEHRLSVTLSSKATYAPR